MADPKKRLESNIEGPFFVDSTCINCDTCRQIALKTFEDTGEYSSVYKQPETEADIRDATRALLACPTGSIGIEGTNLAKEVMHDFPLLIEEPVYYCGFNSYKSYGGNSYFIQHPDGNWMVDAPKFLPHLVQAFEKQGGLSRIFLTHRDDVADADQYAKHFNAERIIHQEELSSQPGAEKIIDGYEDILIHEDFRIVPTPGHTQGHCVLLFKNRFLFTGDHLSGSRIDNRLRASSQYCWYSWEEHKKSLAKLLNYQFSWILPGHGRKKNLPPKEMKQALKDFVDQLK